MKRYALTLSNRSAMFVTAAHFAPYAATSRGGAVTTSDNINVFRCTLAGALGCS